MTVVRRQSKTLHDSDPSRRHAAQFGCWRELGPRTETCIWSRAHSARDAASMTRRRRTGSGCEHNNTIGLPPVPPAATALGDAETCPALLIRGLVPAQFLHKFPIPDTPLFGCGEAATSDIIASHPGERTMVAFVDASGGCYAPDTRHRLVGTAAIILDFPGDAWSDIENMSIQQLLDKTASTQHDFDEEETEHSTEPLSRALRKPSRCGQAGCKRSLERRKRRQGASFGPSFSPSHILAYPCCTTPTIWGSCLGFTQTAISFPVQATQETTGTCWILFTNRGSSVSRRSWARTWPTPWRACRLVPWKAAGHRYISNKSLPASAKGSYVVNVAAHQVPSGPSTASLAAPRLNSCLQRGACPATLDTRAPLLLDAVPSTDARGLVPLADMSHASAHSSSQPSHRVLSKAGRRNMVAVQNGRKLD